MRSIIPLFLAISTRFISYHKIEAFMPQYPRHITSSRNFVTPNDKYNCPSLEELFGKGGVLIFDKDVIQESPFLFETDHCTIRELPLLPFEDVIFPNNREFLHVTEMRFRYAFQKIEEGDDIFGRCFVTPSGEIGLIGNLCKIVERKSLENGERMYIIESVERFRIRRIVTKSPYLTAEVELYPKDIFVANEIDECEKLCEDIYFLLKLYIRLTKLQSNRSGESEIILSADILDNKPGSSTPQSGEGSTGGGDNSPTGLANTLTGGSASGISGGQQNGDLGLIATRQERFSNACANLLSTERVILQQLLQTQSTLFRLTGVKSIMVQAVGEVSALLADEALLSPQELRRQETLALSSYDDDLRAPAGSGADRMTIAMTLGEAEEGSGGIGNEYEAVQSGRGGGDRIEDTRNGWEAGTVFQPSDSNNSYEDISDEGNGLNPDAIWGDLDDAFQ